MKKYLFVLILLLLCVSAKAADTGYNWGAWGFVADANAASWDENGSEWTTTASGTLAQADSSEYDAVIGSDGTNGWDGNLDNLRFFADALSEVQLKALK